MVDKYINKIINGDCVELLKSIPDNSVDMTFADPPFNLKKKYHHYQDSKEFQDYLTWCEAWILELVRVTKPSGSMFIHNIPKWLTYYSCILNKVADFKHWISWEASTSPMGKTLQPAHYGILFYAKDCKALKFYEVRSPHKRARKSNILAKDYGGKKTMLHPFGPLLSDVWTDIHRLKHEKYRDSHPCQLPIHLLERIILMSTDEGDIVLDPFMGTGTTAIAAKRLDRNFIGFDIDPTYIDIISNKLENEKNKSKLGDCHVSFYLEQIVTLRDKDWNYLKDFFIIPDDITKVDLKPIHLKTKPQVNNPLKAFINDDTEGNYSFDYYKNGLLKRQI